MLQDFNVECAQDLKGNLSIVKCMADPRLSHQELNVIPPIIVHACMHASVQVSISISDVLDS